jgi:hypothetical protein
VRGLEPLPAALALLVIPVGVGAGSGLAPGLLRRRGGRVAGALGLAVMAAGFAALAAVLMVGDASPVGLALGLVVFGLGFGLSITPGTVLILEGLPAERRSVASAVNDITREVGGVLGIAVLSSVLVPAYRADVAAVTPGLPAELAGAVESSAGAALGVAAALGPAGAAVADAARAGFSTGTAAATAVGAGVLLAAAAVCAVAGPRTTAPVPVREGSA